MVKSRLLQLLGSKKKIRITTVERLKNPSTLNQLMEIVGALSKGGYYLYTKKKIL